MTAAGIVRLSDRDLHADVWPANGGRLAAFFSLHGEDRFDWMVSAPDADIDSGASGSWGSFPLVPFSNRIRDARFEWDGEIHRIEATEKGAPNAIHGHGRSLSWTIDQVTAQSIDMSYDYMPGDWPFAYRAEQHIVLADGALSLEMRLVNRGDRSMPAGLGHHPYFPWRGGPVVEAGFEDYWPAVDGVLPDGPVTLPPEFDFSAGIPLPRGLDNGFSGWDGRLSIVWPGDGATLTMCGSAELGHMILFSPPQRNFFCAEPVSHAIDAVNLAARGIGKTGLRRLEPGATMTAQIRFAPSS
ncbi:aldose 1-epimerase [Nisaea sediminum]|uniref:aldose 1-epimerase n=1 Tax=Nisaea sediminum TaxID=2775867 RepID=UPI0018662B1A|nr:aldose 1-epimerase [Nisaea sediminum]